MKRKNPEGRDILWVKEGWGWKANGRCPFLFWFESRPYSDWQKKRRGAGKCWTCKKHHHEGKGGGKFANSPGFKGVP